MICRQALAHARKTLEDSGIENSSLEGEILVRFVSGMDRTELFANLDKELDTVQESKLKELLERRWSGEPSAYITGHKEFYGLDFKVDKRVLIPRPETELLVDKAIQYFREYKYSTIADIGTGSGCIAISLAKYLMDAAIFACDKSLAALEAAKENCQKHQVKTSIKLLQGNLLEPLLQAVDLIVANLPYVNRVDVNTAFEPEMALDGGKDGLDIVHEIAAQVPGKLRSRGALLLEIGQGQAKEVKTILHKVFPGAEIEFFKDLAGIERIVAMRLTA